MPFIRADTLVSSQNEYLMTGEVNFAPPKEEVFYKPGYKYGDFEIDAPYTICNRSLWSNLPYDRSIRYFVFEHALLKGEDVNNIVESGQAKGLTETEGKNLMDSLTTKGYIQYPTIVGKSNKSFKRLLEKYRIERQMLLARIFPDFALAKQVEEQLFADEKW